MGQKTQTLFSTKKLRALCLDALRLSAKTLELAGKKGVTKVSANGNLNIATRADKLISAALCKFFKNSKLPAILYSEETGKLTLTNNPLYTIAIDDLDGTENYLRGYGSLPFCTVVTIFDSTSPCFKDAIAAGVIEHNSGNTWIAIRGNGTYFNGKKIIKMKNEKINRLSLITVDHYGAQKNVVKLKRIHHDAWVKNFGAAAFHLAGVSSGMFDAYVSLAWQKAHELGAGYLLVKESGGAITDLKGKPIDNVKFDFNATYAIVAVSTPSLLKQIVNRISR